MSSHSDSLARSGSASLTSHPRIPWDSLAALAVPASMLIAIAFGTFVSRSLLGVAVAMGLVASTISWIRPQHGLTLMILLVFFVDWMSEELALLPHAATWSIEALLALLTLRALFARFPRRLRGAATDAPVLALLVIGVISSVAHQEPLTSLALGLRAMFRFILMYYVLLNLPLSERAWRQAMKLWFVLMFLQVPIALYEWAVWGRSDDQAFGSLRSTGIVSVMSIMMICFLVGLYLKAHRRLRYLAGVVPFFVIPIIGEAKGFFLLLPATLLFLLRGELLRRPIRTAVVGTAIGSVFVAALVLFPRVGGNADLLEAARRPREMIAAATKPPRVETSPDVNPVDVTLAASTFIRLQSLVDASQRISVDRFTTLFGFGLGSRTFTYQEVELHSSTILYTSPVATRLYELGYVGLGVYWLTLCAPLIGVRRLRRSADATGRAMAFGLSGIVFIYIVGDFYTDMLNDPTAFSFWFFAAFVSCAMYGRPRWRAGGSIDDPRRETR